MGFLAHRLRTLDRSLVIDMSGKFLGSRISCHVSEPYDNFSKYPPFPLKNVIVRGVGGVPQKKERKREERKIMPSTMATMFMPEAQGQRTHSARTKIISM